MKRIISTILMILLLLTLVACGSSKTVDEKELEVEEKEEKSEETKTSKESESEEITLGFSFGQSVHPFFVAMQMGAEQAAEETGVELVVLSADNSLEKQVSQIEDLTQRGVDAILINPYDSEGVANVVQVALEKDIGIFSVDIDVIGAESTAFVASNNLKIGEMLADYVIEVLDGEGDIAIISNPQVTSTKQREDGFLEKISDTNINVVANQGAGMERTTALEAAESILQANPDIKAFVGINESSAMGILNACESQGKTDILVTGVDATEDILNAIKDGTQLSIAVSQDPYQMGYFAVQNAIKWVKGKSIEKFIEVPVDYINADNVDEVIEREEGYKK